MEAGSMARIFAAYVRGVPFIKEQVDAVLGILGAKPGDLAAFQSTLGRTAIRQIETIYIANLMVEWVNELAEAIKAGARGRPPVFLPGACPPHRRGHGLLGGPPRRALPLREGG